jgi:hypothetical protein
MLYLKQEAVGLLKPGQRIEAVREFAQARN